MGKAHPQPLPRAGGEKNPACMREGRMRESGVGLPRRAPIW
ncbi:hypothetical protein NMD1_01613 [Novosphingobium sp. MD-1]|nr:hypothetical protein NMD1_01613 [Novosphingobium sp. MD-1]